MSATDLPPTVPAAGQVWDAEGYARHAGFVAELGSSVLELLAVRPGERVLDLGCGDGTLTKRLVGAGADVTGLEPDPSLAERARQNGIEVLEQDAHDAFGEATFDAVFSNAALHWMREPERVLGHVFAALKPGGRFVAEQGGFGNVAAVIVALEASIEAIGAARPARPWDFPSAGLQQLRLRQAGFEVGTLTLVARPTPLPTGFAGWLRTFAAPFVRELDARQLDAVFDDTARRLDVLQDERGGAFADYVRLRFEAIRPR